MRTVIMKKCRGAADAAFVHLYGIHTLGMSSCNEATITDAAFAHLRGIQELYMVACLHGCGHRTSIRNPHALDERLQSADHCGHGLRAFARYSHARHGQLQPGNHHRHLISYTCAGSTLYFTLHSRCPGRCRRSPRRGLAAIKPVDVAKE